MKRFLSRLLVAALCLAALVSAVSCGGYKPVKSTKEESRAMASLGSNTVRYELVRAFLHAFRGGYDGGDAAVWSSADAETLFAALKADAMAQIAEIYATFAVCEKYGIDPYGNKVDDLVDERVTVDIDGGEIDGVTVEGYGSKKKYLSALGEMHLNDSVNRLLHRWDICSSLLYEKVVTNFNDGANSVTREEVEEFYYSAECAQISWLFISESMLSLYDEAGAEAFISNAYGKLYESRADYDLMKKVIPAYTYNLSYDQIENGFCVSRYGGFGRDARRLAETACALDDLEISERITTEDGVYYLIGIAKSKEYIADSGHYETVYDLCLANRLYKEIDAAAASLLDGAEYTDAYAALTALAELGVK